MIRTLFIALFAATPLTGLAGFGVAAAALNPCSLVTMAQASKALGEPAMAPHVLRDAAQSGCRWMSKSGSQNLFVTIEPSNIFHLVRTSGPSTVVRGLGDAALWSAGWLYVKKHATYVGIELYLSPKSVTRMDPQLFALAKAVVERLP